MRDAGVGAALGHQREDLTLAGSEQRQGVVAMRGSEQRGDDLRVEGRASCGHPSEDAEEIVHVQDPVLEQVPNRPWLTSATEWQVSMCWESRTMPSSGWRSRKVRAARAPSSVRSGGIRMSTMARSGSAASTPTNPFGPIVRGWADVAAGLEHVSSRFLDVEHWRTRVGGKELSDIDLRVTSTYRNEGGEWKVVHRHVPNSSFDADGPIRRTV